MKAIRYREKTWKEKLREAEALEGILRPKAKEKQKLSEGRGKKGYQNSDNLKIDTLKQTAKALDTSHDTLHKVKTIAREKPEGDSLISEKPNSYLP